MLDTGIGHESGVHVVATATVVGFLGAHRTDDGQVMHLLREERQVLADLHVARRSKSAGRPGRRRPGFKSHMSKVDGPPPIHSTMAAF